MPTELRAIQPKLITEKKITWREFNHYDFLLEFKILYMDQRESSVIRSTYCFCRGIEFSS